MCHVKKVKEVKSVYFGIFHLVFNFGKDRFKKQFCFVLTGRIFLSNISPTIKIEKNNIKFWKFIRKDTIFRVSLGFGLWTLSEQHPLSHIDILRCKTLWIHHTIVFPLSILTDLQQPISSMSDHTNILGTHTFAMQHQYQYKPT